MATGAVDDGRGEGVELDHAVEQLREGDAGCSLDDALLVLAGIADVHELHAAV
jgi:hypothetical protein